MAGGTDGNIISYDASGDPVAIATGDDGQVLTSAGAGQPPAFEDAGGGGTITLVADGTIATGAPVHLTSAGKAKQIKGAWDYVREAPFTSNAYLAISATSPFRLHWDDANNKLVSMVRYSNYYLSPMALEVADTTNHYTGIMNLHPAPDSGVFGTTWQDMSYTTASCYDEDTDRLIIVSKVSSALKAFVSGLSGTTWTMGSISSGVQVSASDQNVNYFGAAYDKSENKVLVAGNNSTQDGDGWMWVGTVTGSSTNSIAWAAGVEFDDSSNIAGVQIVYATNISKCVITYRDWEDNANMKSCNINISGTTPSVAGGIQTIKSNLCEPHQSDNNGICYDENAGKIVLFFAYNASTSGSGGNGATLSASGNPNYHMAVAIGTPSSTTTAWAVKDMYAAHNDSMGHASAGARRPMDYFGLDADFNGANTSLRNNEWYWSGMLACCYVPDAQKILVVFSPSDDAFPNRESHGHNHQTSHYAMLGTISGTDITFTSPELIYNGTVEPGYGLGYDQQNDRAVWTFYSQATDHISVIPAAWESGSVEDFNVGHLDQYLGLATTGVSDGADVTVTVAGGVNENQSSLVIGSTYYLAPTGEIHNQLGRHWKGHQITLGQALSATKLLVGSDGYGNNMYGIGKY